MDASATAEIELLVALGRDSDSTLIEFGVGITGHQMAGTWVANVDLIVYSGESRVVDY